jgi:hypothetical protein
LTTTYLDLPYVVSIISIFIWELRERHWNATNRDLGYIKGTKYYDLLYKKNNTFVLIRYSYAIFFKDIDDMTSTLDYLMNMGSPIGLWMIQNGSKKA